MLPQLSAPLSAMGTLATLIRSRMFSLGAVSGCIACLTGLAIKVLMFGTLYRANVVIPSTLTNDTLTVEQLWKLDVPSLFNELVNEVIQLQEEVQRSKQREEEASAALEAAVQQQLQAVREKAEAISGALKQQRAAALHQQTQAGVIRRLQAASGALDASARCSNKSSAQPIQLRETSLWQRWRQEDRPELWQQRAFKPVGAYGFIQFSAYRISRHQVTVLGWTTRGVPRKLEGCTWHGLDRRRIHGEASITYNGDHHEAMYETTIIFCKLKEEIREGGGFLELSLDNERLIVFREPKGTPADLDNPPYPYDLTFCGPPMFGEIKERLVAEFMEYHLSYVGVDHFVLYDAGAVTPTLVRHIRPFIDAGLVTVTGWHGSLAYEIWWFGQSINIHDCGYRMRFLTKWIMVHDFDEYIEIVPPQPLKDFLRKYEGRPWVSHGCALFSISHCIEGGKAEVEGNRSFLITPLQFRHRGYYCEDEKFDHHFCLNYWGHRKLITNPRMSVRYNVHFIGEYDGHGVNLDADVLRHAHYHGLAYKPWQMCPKGPPAPDSTLMRSRGLARITQAVISCRGKEDAQACVMSKLTA